VSSDSCSNVWGSGGKDVSSDKSVFLFGGGGVLLWLDGSSFEGKVSIADEGVWEGNVKSGGSLVEDVLSNGVSSSLVEVVELYSDSESSFGVSSSGGEVSKNDGVEVFEALLGRVGIGEGSEGWVEWDVGLSGSKVGKLDSANPGVSSFGWWCSWWEWNEEEGSADSEVGGNGVSFSSKDGQSVVISNSESQAGSDSGIAQVNVSVLCSVDSSEVECQLSVDKNPQVIISSEGEGFSSLKGELGVDFSGEVEVVSRVGVVSISESLSIDGEVVGVVIHVDSRAGGSLCQGDGLGEGHVDSSGVSVPLREGVGSSDCGG